MTKKYSPHTEDMYLRQIKSIGETFFVNSAGKHHLHRRTNEIVSDNELTQAAGCLRRVLTCKE